LKTLADYAVDRDLFAAGVLQDIEDFNLAVRAKCESAKKILNSNPSDPELRERLQDLRKIGAKLGEYATAILREDSAMISEHKINALIQDVTQFWQVAPTFDISPPTLGLTGDKHHCRMLLAVVLKPMRGKVGSVTVRGSANNLQFFADLPLTLDPVAPALARRLGMSLANDGPNKIVVAIRD
jgi:hypothetical protein